MARNPKPLRILVTPAMKDWPEVQELIAKGHLVHSSPGGGMPTTSLGAWWEYDLILGPTCWRMTEQHRKYLVPVAVPAARKARYPGKDGAP